MKKIFCPHCKLTFDSYEFTTATQDICRLCEAKNYLRTIHEKFDPKCDMHYKKIIYAVIKERLEKEQECW